ncbi:hypothetical protein TCAL_16844 [Tigriopus californicus]|uniref:Uncharacterized protein n=1 Tax=Tigriopus californicus TaxID=6832 RepID=A0A553PDY8_TIGCA|nr:hypothetical protein TCAL_16844 [Tigriopus californicus]
MRKLREPANVNEIQRPVPIMPTARSVKPKNNAQKTNDNNNHLMTKESSEPSTVVKVSQETSKNEPPQPKPRGSQLHEVQEHQYENQGAIKAIKAIKAKSNRSSDNKTKHMLNEAAEAVAKSFTKQTLGINKAKYENNNLDSRGDLTQDDHFFEGGSFSLGWREYLNKPDSQSFQDIHQDTLPSHKTSPGQRDAVFYRVKMEKLWSVKF